MKSVQLTAQEEQLVLWFRNMDEIEQKQWQDFLDAARQKHVNPYRLKKIVEELMVLNLTD